jgi:hypothetical protein
MECTKFLILHSQEHVQSLQTTKFYRMLRIGVHVSALHWGLSIYGSTVLCWALAAFFSFLILYTVGRIPWTGD